MNNEELQVKNFVFKEFQSDTKKIEDRDSFEFTEFRESEILDVPEKKKNLRIEKKFANENSFIISPIVKKHRGINKLEEEETERRVQDLVNKKVSFLEEDAFKKGYEEGIKQGRDEIFQQTIAATEEKLEQLTEMISSTLQTQSEILKNQKMEIYETIRNLTKWVILRELKEDGQYIERLLEKLIVEIQTQSNLLIRVNKNNFENMPEILKHIEEKMGSLHNVRVEADYDIGDLGIVIESVNGIINGTIDQQFKNLDKLFESVGLESQEE